MKLELLAVPGICFCAYGTAKSNARVASPWGGALRGNSGPDPTPGGGGGE